MSVENPQRLFLPGGLKSHLLADVMFSTAEVLTLARAYAAATSCALSTVADRALGERNSKAFLRLSRGQGINANTLERAALWFMTNWPEGTPWPADVPGGPVTTVTPRKKHVREVPHASKEVPAESH